MTVAAVEWSLTMLVAFLVTIIALLLDNEREGRPGLTFRSPLHVTA